jgi:hypothetical protein
VLERITLAMVPRFRFAFLGRGAPLSRHAHPLPGTVPQMPLKQPVR